MINFTPSSVMITSRMDKDVRQGELLQGTGGVKSGSFIWEATRQYHIKPNVIHIL